MKRLQSARGGYDKGGVYVSGVWCGTCKAQRTGHAYGYMWPFHRCTKCDDTALYLLTDREWKARGYKKETSVCWVKERV